MNAFEELMAFVAKVKMLRNSQRRYATRQVGTSLSQVRKLEQDVDELVAHLLNAPVPIGFPIPPLVQNTVEILPLPDSALPPLPANVVPMPFEVPDTEIDLPEQPAEQPAQVEQPRGRRRGRGDQSADSK